MLFDNWKEEQDRIHNDYDAENAWYAGQQSQQSKIELLEKELTETQAFLNKQNHIKQTKIDELQSRVVELTKTLSEVQMMSHKSISYEHDLFDKGWNQASKQVVINIHRLTGIGEGLLK